MELTPGVLLAIVAFVIVMQFLPDSLVLFVGFVGLLCAIGSKRGE